MSSVAVAPVAQRVDRARRLSAVLSALALAGSAVSFVWLMIELGPPHGCAMGGLALILVGVILLLVTAGVIGGAGLAVAFTNPGTARWPWFLVLAVDFFLLLVYSTRFLADGDLPFAVFVTAMRVLPLASLAVFAASSVRGTRPGRAAVELCGCLLLLAWVTPAFVGNGSLGDLTSGFASPPPAATATTTCGGAA